MVNNSYTPRHRKISPADYSGSKNSTQNGSLPEPGKKKSLARASALMASGTLVSRILGMIRSPILLVLVVGLNSPIANAFDIANKLPNVLFNVIAGGLINAVLVPAIVHASEQSEELGNKFINKLLTMFFAVMIPLTLLLTLAAPAIVKLVAGPLDNNWYQITVFFAYWCIPQIFFYGLYAILGQILNARESFGPYTWVPAANNIIAITGLIILIFIFGPASLSEVRDASIWSGSRGLILAIFTTLGVAGQALLLFIPLRLIGIRFRPDFAWRGVGLGAAGRSSLWVLALTVVGIAAYIVQSNSLAGATQRALNQNLDITTIGGNATYTVSQTIMALPVSVVTVSIITAVFTRLSKAAGRDDYQEVRRQALNSAKILLSFGVFASVCLFIFATPLARFFIPSGTVTEVESLSTTIRIICWAIIPNSISLLYARVFFAYNDTRKIFIISLPYIAFLVSGYFISGTLDPGRVIIGIALSYVLGETLHALLITGFARQRIHRIGLRTLLLHLGKLATISFVLLLLFLPIVFTLEKSLSQSSGVIAFAALAIGGTFALITFYIGAKLWKLDGVDEVSTRLQKIQKRLIRR
ncbi:MAG: lipid II flippase MurJ [Arcanobacterium sp.]|nr:lipid II flippase MurJ [Arcanobacterium sp.]